MSPRLPLCHADESFRLIPALSSTGWFVSEAGLIDILIICLHPATISIESRYMK